MNLRDKTKELANQKKVSVAKLERALVFGNGSISKWNKQSPSTEKLKKVADYFNVSTDYLLSRTDKQTESRQQTISEALDTAMANDNKKLDQYDKNIIKSLIKAYLDNKK